MRSKVTFMGHNQLEGVWRHLVDDSPLVTATFPQVTRDHQCHITSLAFTKLIKELIIYYESCAHPPSRVAQGVRRSKYLSKSESTSAG
jgi:hypothetical protein